MTKLRIKILLCYKTKKPEIYYLLNKIKITKRLIKYNNHQKKNMLKFKILLAQKNQ